MNDAQRTIEHVSGILGQHTPLDDLLGELYPEGQPELLLEARGTAGRWEVRQHRVYRFPDDSLADLSYSAPLGPDGNPVEPQCAGIEVYALVRQAVEYVTADQRHALEDDRPADQRQPVAHITEWALQYGREGEERVEIIGTGAHAERLARTWHAKQSTPDQLAQTSWQRLTLVARDVYLAPWRTIDTPTTGTADHEPSTTSAPQTTGQK